MCNEGVTSCNSAVRADSHSSRRARAYQRRPARSRLPRRWLSASSAVLAIAALGGCASGGPAFKISDPAPTATPGVTLASVPPTRAAHPKATTSKQSKTAGKPSPTASGARTGADPAPTTADPATSAATGGGSTAGCVTSAQKGACGPYTYPAIEGASQSPTVGQNVWAPISGWQQTLYASNPGSWSVAVNGPAGNTAVVSYPNTGASYGEKPLSSFHSIVSSFAESMPHNSGTSGWAAFDLWFNNWNDEVMIQHDFTDNGACGAVATHTFGGSNGVPAQTWHLCVFGSERVWKLGTDDNHLQDEQSGSVDILSMVTWMENNGYLPRNSTVTDLSYGFEICSTGGKPENWSVSRFSISAS